MKSFKSLGVCDELIQALQKQGIKEPTPIQACKSFQKPHS